MLSQIKRDLKSAALAISCSNSTLAEKLSGPLFSRMNIDFKPPRERVNFAGTSAAACISIDFDVTQPDRFESNRSGTKRLVELGEKYRIPMTWAICGMTAEQDPESYQAILGSEVKHEIGVHTYSHIAIPEHDDETIRADIEHCISVLHLPYRPTTFVFPWNREGRYSLIRELGFRTFRGKWRAIGVPEQVEGMLKISPVQYLGPSSYGSANVINKLMDVCVKYNSIFHLWFHPWDLVHPSLDRFCSATLEPVLSHMSQLRETGKMNIMTLGQLSESYASSYLNMSESRVSSF